MNEKRIVWRIPSSSPHQSLPSVHFDSMPGKNLYLNSILASLTYNVVIINEDKLRTAKSVLCSVTCIAVFVSCQWHIAKRQKV